MDNKKKCQQQYMMNQHMHAARDNIPKGDWGWSAVIPASLKKVGDDLEKACEIIGRDAEFQGWKCKLDGFQQCDFETMLKQYPKKLDTAIYAMRPGQTRAKAPYASVVHLANTVALLMQKMDIELEFPWVLEVPGDSESSRPAPVLPVVVVDSVYGPGVDSKLTMKRDEGKTVLYLIIVQGSFFFKFGTYKLIYHPKNNADGPCILDRFHRGPPKYMPKDVVWQNDRLKLFHFVYTMGVEPDIPLHAILHAEATKRGLPDTGRMEFHHEDLVPLAISLMYKASDALAVTATQTDGEGDTRDAGTPPTDLEVPRSDRVQTPAAHGGLSPADIKYNVQASIHGWDLLVPSPAATTHTKDVSAKAACAAIEWLAAADSGAASGSSAPPAVQEQQASVLSAIRAPVRIQCIVARPQKKVVKRKAEDQLKAQAEADDKYIPLSRYLKPKMD